MASRRVRGPCLARDLRQSVTAYWDHCWGDHQAPAGEAAAACLGAQEDRQDLVGRGSSTEAEGHLEGSHLDQETSQDQGIPCHNHQGQEGQEDQEDQDGPNSEGDREGTCSGSGSRGHQGVQEDQEGLDHFAGDQHETEPG